MSFDFSTALLYLPLALLGVGVVDVIRRKAQAPHKPLLTCMLDTVCYLPYILEVGPWGEPNDIDTAIVAAMKKTGLKDVGLDNSEDTRFMTRYGTARRVGLKNCKATYSPTGYWIAESNIEKRMEVRLKLVDYLKRHPAVLDVKINDPVFVIGFPRTGTTFLHELLARYPEFRSHYTWEQVDSIPSTDSEDLAEMEADRRKKHAANKARFDLLLQLAGDSIQSVHRIGYEECEECTTPCALELPWAVAELPFVAYACEEVIALGAGDTFEWYRKQLQLFTFQAKDRRDADFTWMLKCPFHLPYLTELHATFPNCTVVWTHRDPCECIASCCSLYEHLMWACFEVPSIDRVALGRYVMKYTQLALSKAFESIETAEAAAAKGTGPAFKVVHIRYAATLKDPKGMCKQILEKVGRPYTDKYDGLLDEYLAENAAKRKAMKADKGGKKTLHEYRLEDYGLSRAGVEEAFRWYIDRYSLKEESKRY